MNQDQEIERLKRDCEILAHERDAARKQADYLFKVLHGIHKLLYPAPIKTIDGRIMLFRPSGLNLHEVLQELSDRIRAIPDEISKSVRQTEAGSVTGVTDSPSNTAATPATLPAC